LKHLNPGQNIIKCVRTANEHSRQASIVAAENVSGVTKVHDHLCWVEPMSGMYLNSPEDDSLLKAH
jgi:hypothetical protein